MTDSVYTVTPPDLRVTESGPSIMMLGVAFDAGDPYVELFDSLFPDSDVTIYTSESGIDSDNIAWYRAALSMSSTVIVDIDNATPEEVFLGLQAEIADQPLVFWVSPTHASPNLHKLLNSYQYSVFGGCDEIRSFLEEHFGKSG